MRIALVGLLVITTSGRAQSPEHHGLTGSLLLGAATWTLDDGSSPTHFTGGLAAGYRIRLFDIGGSVVSLTPRVALVVTKFTGIRLNSTQIGFARLDVPSFQLAVRLKAIRPYALVDFGTLSIERYVGADLVNFYGKSKSFGFGVEIPRNNPCGAGFDLAARWMSGTLSNTEWRGTDRVVPVGGDISGAIFTVGCTGAFGGWRLLFSCGCSCRLTRSRSC
jgi:hypothetical protein